MTKRLPTYAGLTDEQRDGIVRMFEYEMEIGARLGGSVGQTVAGTAKNFFGLTSEEWNSPKGANAYALVVAVLFFRGAPGFSPSAMCWEALGQEPPRRLQREEAVSV